MRACTFSFSQEVYNTLQRSFSPQQALHALMYVTEPAASFSSLQEVSDFDLFELNDIDKAFTKTVKTVKHHQPVNLVLQGTAMRIVGYPAGHMLGGTVWVLEAGSEVVVYGVDTNHNKER
jgi:Cft2 family RNA processing exonuclease